MRFSERHGFKKPKVALSADEVPDSLRSKLWNGIHLKVIPHHQGVKQFSYHNDFRTVLAYLAQNFFGRTIDGFDQFSSIEKKWLKRQFMETKFPEFYDLVEAIGIAASELRGLQRENFESWCNQVFEEELAAFRFVDHQLVSITDENEIEEVERAINQPGASSVSKHISKAVELFSKRPDPDYANTVKEAISAVEAAAQYITGTSKVLSDALKILEQKHGLHPALKDGYTKIYAYTSDAGGIRHALKGDGSVGEEEARYMIVSCSAFSNYLIGLASRSKTEQ